MTKAEFAALYNPDNRCLVEYAGADGKRKGIALDTAWKSTAGHFCVNIDSFANAVKLRDVISVTDTGTPWVQQQKA